LTDPPQASEEDGDDSNEVSSLRRRALPALPPIALLPTPQDALEHRLLDRDDKDDDRFAIGTAVFFNGRVDCVRSRVLCVVALSGIGLLFGGVIMGMIWIAVVCKLLMCCCSKKAGMTTGRSYYARKKAEMEWN
jgi:hypothetical protein